MPEEQVTVAKAASGDRYEISVDGTVAGAAEYVDRGGQRIFFHTLVERPFSGRGLASRLVTEALDDTRRDGQRVVPVCSYVAGYLNKHRQYADMVDDVTPDVLDVIPR